MAITCGWNDKESLRETVRGQMGERSYALRQPIKCIMRAINVKKISFTINQILRYCLIFDYIALYKHHAVVLFSSVVHCCHVINTGLGADLFFSTRAFRFIRRRQVCTPCQCRTSSSTWPSTAVCRTARAAGWRAPTSCTAARAADTCRCWAIRELWLTAKTETCTVRATKSQL